MESAWNETDIPPTLSQSQSQSLSRSTIEEKLAMISPNNNLDRVDLQSPRPATSRPVRTKKPYSRRRSLDSITFDSLQALRALGNDSNHKNEKWTVDETPAVLTSPNNSHNGFNRADAQRITTSPQPRNRPSRPKNAPYNRRRSFDSTFFAAALAAQKVSGDDNQVNDRSRIEEKLSMTSPNNNLNRFDIPRLVGSRPNHPRRPMNRRRSLGATVVSVPIPSPERKSDDNRNIEGTNELIANTTANGSSNANASTSATAPIANASRHTPIVNPSKHERLKRSQHTRASHSLPSTSGHSFLSNYTEMTIYSDTHLLTKDQEESSSSSSGSSSCYYSDAGIPYDPKLSYSIQINVEEDDYEDDDDSSNANFNYQGRDNGSLHTLESAFSLNDLDSADTVSSLSINDLEDDTNEVDPEKRLQFLIPPSHPTRQHQRQSRRSSYKSIGRRRRRPSCDSMINSDDDIDGLTAEEEEVTLDGNIPNIPNLPNRVSSDDVRMENSNRGNREEVNDQVEEDQTVEESSDDENSEYIEEILLNDISDCDESSKRYDVIISEESFDEIVIEMEEEEEEITVTDYDFEYEDMDEKTEFSEDYRNENNDSNDNIDSASHVEEKSICSADDNSNDDSNDYIKDDNKDNNKNSPPNIDEKIVFSETCNGHDGNKDVPPYIDEKQEFNADCQRDDNIKDISVNVEEKTEFRADCHGDDGKKDIPSKIVMKLEFRADCHGDDGNKGVPQKIVIKLESNADCQSDNIKKETPENIEEKTECSADCQSDDVKKYASVNIEEAIECTVDRRSDDNKKDASVNIEEKIECIVDHRSDDNKNDTSVKIEEKIECSVDRRNNFKKKIVPPKSYRDTLLGS